MLIVEYQSKSYHHFLNDMPQIANHKTRFLITFNGASACDLAAASADLTSYTESTVQHSSAINDQASETNITSLFSEARTSRNILLLENSDLLFDKRTAVKGSHERESSFNINYLFKNIAKHNGIVILANDKPQTLSASMSTKVDVLIRFPSV